MTGPAFTVGVDPGNTGAIAVLDGDKIVVIHDMPVADGHVSEQMVASLESWAENVYGTVVIERVHSMPKQGVSSTGKFMEGYGILKGVFAMAHRPMVFVAPHKWKSDLRLGKGKDASRQRACELWPADADLFRRAKDDGRAEAALIAWWHQHHG